MMKVSKFTEVVISNARVSLEALLTLLRLMKEMILPSLPQDALERVKWDIGFHTSQGETLSLQSPEIGDDALRWIRERVIVGVHVQVQVYFAEVKRSLELVRRKNDNLTIKVSGNSDFVDLARIRLIEWKEGLPPSRPPLFGGILLIVGIGVCVVSYFGLDAVLNAAFSQFGMGPKELFSGYELVGGIVSLLLLAGIFFPGIIAGIFLSQIWPPIDFDIGSATPQKKWRGKIFACAKWASGILAVGGGIVAFYNFLFD